MRHQALCNSYLRDVSRKPSGFHPAGQRTGSYRNVWDTELDSPQGYGGLQDTGRSCPYCHRTRCFGRKTLKNIQGHLCGKKKRKLMPYFHCAFALILCNDILKRKFMFSVANQSTNLSEYPLFFSIFINNWIYLENHSDFKREIYLISAKVTALQKCLYKSP